MERPTIIRILSGLMFLTFLCPFFQMCSDKILKKPSLIKFDLRKNPDLITYNRYNLSIYSHISDQSWEEFIWPEVFFTFIILISFGILVSAFKNKNLIIKKFSSISLILGISFIVCMLLIDLLTDFRQIKYGYYLFFINTIAIIVLSTKQKRAQNGIRAANHTTPHLT